MVGNERRRHVRLKPSVELPVRVVLLGDSPVRETLDVNDLSVGGLALSSPALKKAVPGERLKLLITLGRQDEYAVDVVTRWTSENAVGVELVDAPVATAQALGRFLAELLERGGSS